MINKNAKGRMFVGKRSTSKGMQVKRMFHALLAEHKPEQKMEGPLSLLIAYCYPWKKTEPKKNKVTGWKWKDTRPDADNLPKTLKDCMTDLGFWGDDGQVAQLLFEKSHCDREFIRIKITQLDPLKPPAWYGDLPF